jgi:MFS family permease
MLRNPVTLLRGLPPTVRLLVAGTFINKLGSFIIPFLTIILKREFRLSGTEVGALVMAYGAGSLVAILTGGVLTDRLGRRKTLLVSLFGSGTLAVALAFSPSLRAFATLLILFGFVADLYRPASTSIIADLLPSNQRAVGFAAMRMAINLGFAMGMTLGGLLADWSWRVLFVGDGVTTALFGALVYFFIPETRPAMPAADAPAPLASSRTASPWRDGVFLQVMAVSFLFALVFFSHITALPLTMTVNAGYPARLYGMLIGTNGLLIALFEVSIVHRLRGWRRLRVAAVGAALCGIGFGLSGLVLHWAWFLVTVVIWTAGEIFSTPFKMAFVSDWAPPALRGRYVSLYQATWSVAVALNPILFLPLQARLGDRAFWPLMMLVTAPAVLVLLHLDRIADRPERLRGLAHEPAGEAEAGLLAPAPLQG